ncbi:MAG: 6-bladed beta-propeller [Anaerolineaceae bacterium]|nr:6-bladed beta-propeller [Anaerolineaceae bacterium]
MSLSNGALPVFLAAVLVLGGCAGSQERKSVHRIWPPPPAAPRIELQQIVQGPTDFSQPGFWERVADVFTGQKKHRLLRPQSAAVGDDGRLYVADPELQGVHIFQFNSSKSEFLTRAGRQFFVSPVAVAVCTGGKLAVADSALAKVFLFGPDGKFEKTIEKPGGFARPTGLAFDARRKLLYVVDTLANEVCVFDLSGRLVRRFGSPGTAAGQFNYPTYICLDAAGKVYVTDSLNFRVQVFDQSGRYLFHVGQLGDASGFMAVPKGVGVDSFGNIYVVDSYLTTVQVFDQRGRFLLAFGERGDGPGSFHVPTGLLVDSQNRIMVCDSHNNRLQIFRYIGEDNEKAPDARQRGPAGR